MKKTFLFSLIIVVVMLCLVTAFVLKKTNEQDDPIYSVSYSVEIDENTVVLRDYAKTLDYKELTVETLSSIADRALSLFDEYEKIILDNSFYTHYIGNNVHADINDTEVIIYTEKAGDRDHKIALTGLLVELFKDDLIYDPDVGPYFGRYSCPTIKINTEYKEKGFRSYEKLLDKNSEMYEDLENIDKDIREIEYFDNIKRTDLTEKELKKIDKLNEKRNALVEKLNVLTEDTFSISLRSGFSISTRVEELRNLTVSEIAAMK